MSEIRDAIDRLHSRVAAQGGLSESVSTDLINLLTVLMLRESEARGQLGEARSQIEMLISERDRNRGIVTEAQRIASSSSHTLTSIIHRLVDAGQDVYVSALVSQGVEITYQPCDAEKRSDECTFVGLTLDEVVASAHQHLTETT